MTDKKVPNLHRLTVVGGGLVIPVITGFADVTGDDDDDLAIPNGVRIPGRKGPVVVRGVVKGVVVAGVVAGVGGVVNTITCKANS